MDNNTKETLLALYKEKMSYLVAYDKIYSWILGLLGMGLIASIGFVLQHDVLQPKVGSSDFYDGEFPPPFSVEKLCTSINYDVSKVSKDGFPNDLLHQPTNTVIWLNALLRETGLYNTLFEKKLDKELLSDNVKALLSITENDRTKRFSNLNTARQTTIKKLNRLLLEETYPWETPKNQDESDTTSKIIPFVIFGLFPLLINAWFSAYIFCYWYSYLLCQNIEYIEKLLTNDLFVFPYKFATWYNDFFSIFYGETHKKKLKTLWRKLPAYTLFIIIGIPLMALYGTIFYEIVTPSYFIEVFSINRRWIALCFYGTIPALILGIHICRALMEKGKLIKIYEAAKIEYQQQDDQKSSFGGGSSNDKNV